MIPYQVHGLPVHPLAVHAAVVLVPLAALLAFLFLVPRTRSWAALPMAAVSVAAVVACWVSRESGFNLKQHFVGFSQSQRQFDDSVLGKAIDHHESLALVLSYIMIAFAAVAVVVYLMWLRPRWWPSALQFRGAAQYAASAVLLVGALGVAYQTYLTGEAGSKAVYNPDGSQNYAPVATVPSRG
jgi:hypothetical protein